MSYTYEYPRPAVTADAVIFRMDKGDSLNILLVKRKNEPFKGNWALPGGFIDENESLEECVAREVKEETGLRAIVFFQLETFSSVDRDPRHRTITTAYWGFCENEEDLKPGSDAEEVRWFQINELPDLAFDHNVIIKKALRRALEVMAF